MAHCSRPVQATALLLLSVQKTPSPTCTKPCAASAALCSLNSAAAASTLGAAFSAVVGWELPLLQPPLLPAACSVPQEPSALQLRQGVKESRVRAARLVVH